MSIFDIVGPVMVGPSSSHTAGAVRIGYICYKLMDEPIYKVEIGLYGSFLATGKVMERIRHWSPGFSE